MYTLCETYPTGLKVEAGVTLRVLTAMAKAIDSLEHGLNLDAAVAAGAIISADFILVDSVPENIAHIERPCVAFYLRRGGHLECLTTTGAKIDVRLPLNGKPYVERLHN